MIKFPRSFACCALAALTLVPFSSAQAAKRPMTFEDMMNMKRLGETAVSPDGKWLAYSVTTVDLAQNIKTAELWLQGIAGGEPFKIAVTQPGDSNPEFAPDNQQILFVSSRENGQQLWLADFDSATGATSSAKKLTNISTGADSPKWSPNGHSVVFISSVYPDCPAITPTDAGAGDRCNQQKDTALAASKVKAQIFTQLLYRHWNHYTGEKRSHLFLLDVAGGGIRDLTPNDPHDVPPFSLSDSSCGCDFSPDSKELAFTENPDPVPAISTSAQIFLLDLTDASAKARKISTSAGGNFNPAYSPDGKYIAWRSQARAGYESDRFQLVLYDRLGRTIRGLLPNMDHWIDEFIWSPDSGRLYFTSGDQGGEPIYSVGVNANRFFILAVGGGQFSGLAISQDGRNLIASGMHLSQPPEVYLLKFPPPGPEHRSEYTGEHQLTHLNDSLLGQLDFGDAEDFEFMPADMKKAQSAQTKLPGSDGIVIGVQEPTEGVQGFLLKPPGFDPAKKYPVKFLIHGGPEGDWGDAWSYRWNAELFAANGYVVIMINPRGSTGYGQAFVDGVNGDWGGKPFTDLMTGLDYAEEHYPFIDKTRECALGASYGGYMANWVLGHTNRFKCIVSHDGMFDAESAFGSTEEDWFNIWEFKTPESKGGHPWDYYGKPDSENPFRKWSPSLSAKSFKTPTLVVHGQLDFRLDVSEGFQLFDTLQLLGVPSKMLYFPDEGHWVLKPQNSQLWYKTVNEWVDQWTGKAAK
jgi:dipeptidyl aminopeptidase/acylaminoacyl peptidase